MKLKLNKKNIKNLSLDSQVIPANVTPQIAGGYTAERCGSGPTDGGGGSATYGTTACASDRTCNNVTTQDSRPHCAPQEDTYRGEGC